MHFSAENMNDLHSAFCLYEDQNTGGFAPTPGQIKEFLELVKGEKTEARRKAKRDEPNNYHHDFGDVDLADLKSQWGLVPAWRINSDGSPGWNWGGIENCQKCGTTVMFNERVELYIRKSHLAAFNRYHADHKADFERADWRKATQAPGMETYSVATTDRDAKGKEVETRRSYVRANSAGRAQIREAYQSRSRQEIEFGGYEASEDAMSLEWLEKYQASEHYRNAMSRIESAKGPLASAMKKSLGAA